ncbi:MAG: nicotinate-nucleotide diphosphorylase (carboxylating), partial [Oscillospiraceae bacterium]|nr:nicotinate-nucleotide diphosphorylase (carboxylating) [Oscillospiraceae bacterium]
ASDGIENAVAALRAKLGHMTKIEVEVKNFEELQQAINSGADIIMLDNMQPSEMKKAAEITNGRALLEASGNITEQNIAEVAKSGVDIISSGALTHSVAAFDISLKFD